MPTNRQPLHFFYLSGRQMGFEPIPKDSHSIMLPLHHRRRLFIYYLYPNLHDFFRFQRVHSPGS